MIVILLRHAVRDPGLYENPSLNEEGKQQAQRLVAAAHAGIFPVPTSIYSSPKKRCSETVGPLCNEFKLTSKVENNLDEQWSHENLAIFRQRIQTVLNSLVESDKEQCFLLCTHSDWLQEAMSLLPTNDTRIDQIHSFPCASPLTFEVKEGFWSLLKG